MRFVKCVFLINTEIVEDDIGNQKESTTRTKVFCSLESMSQSEFFGASQSGLKPQYKLIMREFEYKKQIYVEIDSTRYFVYRTYSKNDGYVELYLTQKVGVYCENR